MFAIQQRSPSSQAVEYLIEAEEQTNDDEEILMYKDYTDNDEMTVHDDNDDEEQEHDEEIEQNNEQHQESDSNICYEEVENVQELDPDHKYPFDNYLSINHATNRSRGAIEIKCKDEDTDSGAWFTSVKESMAKLTKLNRARAKREINEILSKYEIMEYESSIEEK